MTELKRSFSALLSKSASWQVESKVLVSKKKKKKNAPKEERKKRPLRNENGGIIRWLPIIF